MMKRAALSCLLLAVCVRVFGQPMESDFGDGTADRAGRETDVPSDLSLFYIPLEGSYDLFSRMSDFNFSTVRYARRGYENRYAANFVNGIDLADPLSGQANYHIISALRGLRASPGSYPGLAASNRLPGGLCGIAEYSVRPSEARTGHQAAIFASDRRYRWGMRASSAGAMNDKGWYYGVSASRRWGRDGHVRGVFTDETQAAIALEKQFSDSHSLTFFALGAPSKQGLRSAASQESFALTGNNLYNPSWGWWDGEEVNSRVRENFQPFFMLTYEGRANDDTKWGASLSALTGRSAYSGLRWYRADNPYPDYYRKLPGFVREHQPEAYEAITDSWRTADPAWTQIDWEGMSLANKANAVNGDPAAYVVENRVERTRNFQAAAWISRRIDTRTTFTGSVRIRRDHTRNFKEIKNMLGGAYLLDVDEFLIDDEFYADRVQNNLRDPDRRVGQGDRFGYDFDMRFDQYGASAQLHYRDNRFRFSASAEGASAAFWREGRYEKEMYPGAGSFGRSERINMLTYTAKLTAGYSFSARQSVELTAMSGDAAPGYEQVFHSPRYRNRTIEKPRAIGLLSAEFNYRLTLNALRLKLTGFYTRFANESDVYQYYDDLAGVYSDMVLTGIDKLHYGAELGAEIRFTSRLYLDLAGSAASYTYESNPTVHVFSDIDGRQYVDGSKSSMKGFRIGSTPQRVASVGLRYSGVRGWYANAAWSYMTESYVRANPLRRMPRVLALAGSEEAFSQFAEQERLPSASVVNLFVSKSFWFGRRMLSLSASLNNLLDRNDIIHSGYEPMRLERIGEGVNRTFRPFANKYLYAYGRTFYTAVSYRF